MPAAAAAILFPGSRALGRGLGVHYFQDAEHCRPDLADPRVAPCLLGRASARARATHTFFQEAGKPAEEAKPAEGEKPADGAKPEEGKDGPGQDADKKDEGKDEGKDESGAKFTFTAQDGKSVELNGESLRKCQESCETSEDLRDADTSTAEATEASAGGADAGAKEPASGKSVEQCKEFCQDQFGPSCFPGDSTVVVRNQGRVALADLCVGSMVLTMGCRRRDEGAGTWELRFEPVLAFLHRSPEAECDFLQVEHSLGQVQLTPDHLLFVLPGERDSRADAISDAVPVRAREALPGDRLLAPWLDGSVATPKVGNVRLTRKRGLYAPLVESGVLFVDGTAASCYAVPSSLTASRTFCSVARALGGMQPVCHAATLPLRIACRAAATANPAMTMATASKVVDKRNQQNVEGIHPYAWTLYTVATML